MPSSGRTGNPPAARSVDFPLGLQPVIESVPSDTPTLIVDFVGPASDRVLLGRFNKVLSFQRGF